MVDKRSVQDYSPPTPQIKSVDGDSLRIFCGDDLPAIGTAVAIEYPTDDGETRRVYAVVRRHAGARDVDAWLPVCPDWIEVGLAVEPTGEVAAFEALDAEVISPGPELIKPAADGDIPLWPSSPDWNQLSGIEDRLSIGIDPIDHLAPLCEGGLNLVVDNSDGSSFLELADRMAKRLGADRSLLASRRPLDAYLDIVEDSWRIDAGDALPSQIASMQLVIALAERLRQHANSLAIVELPELHWPAEPTPASPTESNQNKIADIVGRLGRHLVSTDDARLTSLVLLQMPSNATAVETVVDTLRLGDVDALIYIDDEGRFRPERSNSSVTLDGAAKKRRQQFLRTLDLAKRAREKAAIVGERELNDAEREALENVDEMRPVIADDR